MLTANWYLRLYANAAYLSWACRVVRERLASEARPRRRTRPGLDVIRTGELQVWFLAEHLVDTPLVRNSEPAATGG